MTARLKRGYSRDFTPTTERRVKFEADWIPAGFADVVRAKAKRQGISIRALILALLAQWLNDPSPDPPSTYRK